MSNELSTPKLLICPSDTRVAAKDFGLGFSITNLSYFLSLDAEETYPGMFLSGDRNLTNGLPIQNGILVLPPNRPVGFTHELHNGQGNIALADGSVQGWTSSRLSDGLVGSPAMGMTNRLAMP
jgi:prepilin-type processing-associated H-X9-DG protein